MTLTIELPDAIGAAFDLRAQQNGLKAEEFARQLIEREAQPELPSGPLDDIVGALRGKLPSVDEFYAERMRETLREEGLTS